MPMLASKRQQPPKDGQILIVGAGIFGLSTAIHAARRGYTNITVFDYQAYDQSRYEYEEGCDAASADINKIVRTAYGTETDYQKICVDSIREWRQWNNELASGDDLPPGMSASDRVFINNGNTSLNGKESMHSYDKESVINANGTDPKRILLVTSDPKDQLEAEQGGFAFAIDPFRRRERKMPYIGVLDTTGGYAVAHKACWLAVHKARRLGVRFVLGQEAGGLRELRYSDESQTQVSGIVTQDGKFHSGSMVLIACGAWTPSLVPDLDGVCEATAGSVAFIQIPKSSALFERFSPANFPSFQFKMHDGEDGGLYGFPCDHRGRFKLGYRGIKYTNPVLQSDGKERSVPITRWTRPIATRKVPSHALNTINRFIDEELPEIRAANLKVTSTRLCWYTDTFDDHFVIDYVPGKSNLMVATGGSGHAFKFLPVIGKYVVDIWEGIGTDQLPKKRWLWRTQTSGAKPPNTIMEGSAGPNTLFKADLVTAHGQGSTAKL